MPHQTGHSERGLCAEELGASLAQMTQLECLSISAEEELPTNLGDGLSRLTSHKELRLIRMQGGVPIIPLAAMAGLEHLHCSATVLSG